MIIFNLNFFAYSLVDSEFLNEKKYHGEYGSGVRLDKPLGYFSKNKKTEDPKAKVTQYPVLT